MKRAAILEEVEKKVRRELRRAALYLVEAEEDYGVGSSELSWAKVRMETLLSVMYFIDPNANCRELCERLVAASKEITETPPCPTQPSPHNFSDL